ncbi:MAG: ThiF family adenylyltransferase [Bryobacteraceae bacterium]|nr:ThiF family adenylyltransferase [Bryobacteraceae bacterium]
MASADNRRYSRQILFPGLGEQGQRRLGLARVAIVGCGALGTFHAAALARAGVGHLRIVDRDYVELVNLQRQWLFDERDAAEGLPKAIAAARRLAAINSEIEIEPAVADLNPATAADLLEGADLLLDGADNFETRYLVNDFAIQREIPWIYGAAIGSYGLTMPVLPGRTACLKCLYPEPPSGAQPTCETAGVLNAVTAAVASVQVGDALKILAGKSAELARRITTIDVWSGEIRQAPQPGPSPDCPACTRREFPHLEGRHRAPISLCGRNAVQIHESARPLNLEELKERLAPLGEVRSNEFALRFFAAPFELTVFPDGRAIIKGTTDPGVARGLYAKYVGN